MKLHSPPPPSFQFKRSSFTISITIASFHKQEDSREYRGHRDKERNVTNVASKRIWKIKAGNLCFLLEASFFLSLSFFSLLPNTNCRLMMKETNEELDEKGKRKKNTLYMMSARHSGFPIRIISSLKESLALPFNDGCTRNLSSCGVVSPVTFITCLSFNIMILSY